MKFSVGRYDVVVREGLSNSVMEVSFNHHPGLTTVYIDAPEELIHPVFKNFFYRKIKDVTDQVEKQQKYAEVSRYIPGRHRKVKWSVRKFKSEFTNVNGDIDEAKEAWDYNKAPSGSVKSGKYGDLKSFLVSRKGGSLSLIGDK